MYKFKFVLIIVILTFLFTPAIFATADDQVPTAVFSVKDTVPEVNIDKDGKISVSGAKVVQKAGNSFYTRLYWGQSFLRILIKTGQDTNIVRRFGGTMDASEVNVEDYLNIEGALETGADSLIVKSKKVRDLSDQREMNQFSGTITGFGASSNGFILSTKSQGLITVNIGTSTEIAKGSRIIGLSSVKLNDTVSSMSGVFNRGTNSMDADRIRIFVDMNTFKPRNFQGVLQNMEKVVLPTSLIMTIEGVTYKVNLDADSEIMNNKRKIVGLSRFVVGDTVRVYGTIQESDEPIINATVVRNIDL
jgi:hypothetical protein